MPVVTIDGKEYNIEAGMTVLQACEHAGAEIPRFCYHERLSVAGNCRMCLVEVSPGPPKPQASCALPVADKMIIKTNTPMVKKAREGVMEFLLINHPLDCPICDQGGECDLQDQAMAFGRGRSRFHESKRSVKDKYMGPLIKTHMTRCIHCTRCVRFATEIAGVEELGATGRGEEMEIGTYVEQAVTSELSGNMIDICPVGALTSRPYAFHARPWELKKTESIDIHDAVGSNIRIDTRGKEVMRILPRLNEDINEEWISDKTRFSCDGLKNQRLDRPMIKRNGKYETVSWERAFHYIAEKLKKTDGSKIAAIAGDLVCAESVMSLKLLMKALRSPNIDCRQDSAKIDASNRGSYIFNTTIAGIEKSDACLLIGTNPRYEAPLVNARLRKRWLKGGFKIASIGPEVELTYPIKHLGNSPAVMLNRDHPFASVLEKAKNPMLILGMSALRRDDGEMILSLASEIAEKFKMIREDWNGFNVLQLAAGRVGALDLGFVPDKNGKDVKEIIKGTNNGEIEVLYLLGADEIDFAELGKALVIYQGHHGDRGAHNADVILPGAAYTEKNATYVNLEGRVQRTRIATFPPGEAKEDWKIIKELALHLGLNIGINSIQELRNKMKELAPHFANLDHVAPTLWNKITTKGSVKDTPFIPAIQNFYMTDSISRASKTMAECSDMFVSHKDEEAA